YTKKPWRNCWNNCDSALRTSARAGTAAALRAHHHKNRKPLCCDFLFFIFILNIQFLIVCFFLCCRCILCYQSEGDFPAFLFDRYPSISFWYYITKALQTSNLSDIQNYSHNIYSVLLPEL